MLVLIWLIICAARADQSVIICNEHGQLLVSMLLFWKQCPVIESMLQINLPLRRGTGPPDWLLKPPIVPERNPDQSDSVHLTRTGLVQFTSAVQRKVLFVCCWSCLMLHFIHYSPSDLRKESTVFSGSHTHLSISSLNLHKGTIRPV